MIVETDFNSKCHTLVFENKRRVYLDKSESREFELWFENKRQELETGKADG